MSSDVPDAAQGAAPDDELVERVAAAVVAVPGVHALHVGVADEVASRLPGHRVAGVRLDDERCAVRVVLDHGAPVQATAEAVHRAVGALVDRPVHLSIEDIAPPVAAPRT